jgi:hypothetical protein
LLLDGLLDELSDLEGESELLGLLLDDDSLEDEPFDDEDDELEPLPLRA